MVTVGIAGPGPDWEARFRPALWALRDRIAVRAVYDPVGSRAEQVAAEWNAAPLDSLVALSERADLRAFLLLDSGWHGWESLRLLCVQRKPVFIAAGLGHDAQALGELYQQAEQAGQMLMPGLAARYTPATSRLRELMATRLGVPRVIEVDAMLPNADPGRTTEPGSDPFVSLLDWCRYIVGAAPVRLNARFLNGPPRVEQPGRIVTLEFDGGRRAAPAARAELRIHCPHSNTRPGTSQGFAKGQPTSPGFRKLPGMSGIDANPALRIRVVCEGGTAAIHSATDITWTAGGEPIRESLTSERSESEVMLDLFCRRVAGGLVPVADVADVLRGARLFEAAEHSLATGRPVELSPGE